MRKGGVPSVVGASIERPGEVDKRLAEIVGPLAIADFILSGSVNRFSSAPL
jgi:hypothetical protein